MRALLVVLGLVVSVPAIAGERLTCRFPDTPVIKASLDTKTSGHVDVGGFRYPVAKPGAGGPGYPVAKTWMLDGTTEGPLKNDEYAVYIYVDGQNSRLIVDDRTNPSKKGVCKR